MLGSSARIGEALALRVPDDIAVEDEIMSITISGTLVVLRGQGVVRQSYPKHSEDWRIVTLPSFSAEAIVERLAGSGTR